jgi:hypothetical protein
MGSLFGKTPKPQEIQPPPPPQIQAPSTLADPTKRARAVAGPTVLTSPLGLPGPGSNSGKTLLGQ